jgi:ApaG protein
MTTAITEGVKISVLTEYQPQYSSPHQAHHVFAYKIRIENKSDFTVQLQRRHWFIFEAIGVVREVEGEGVIGLQPILEPGEVHEYVSGSNIKSSIGKMQGYYTMERVMDGKMFKVDIPAFNLIAPFRLN